MRVVAIEEHHIIPEMRSRMDLSLLPPAHQARLHATVGERLADMDAAGIDTQVLSVMLPMPQMLPAETVVPLAIKVNGELHDMVTAHPDRFAAFALLPVTVPSAAADELERAVSELGFVGAMIGGTIGGRFLDDPAFAPILETAARLNVPVYLHPGPLEVLPGAQTPSFHAELHADDLQLAYDLAARRGIVPRRLCAEEVMMDT